MLKHLTALALKPTGAVRPRQILGAFPDTLDLEALALALEDKPNLKRLDEQLLVLVPDVGATPEADHRGWTAWLFDRMPPVTELPGLIDKLKALSAGLRQSVDAVAPTTLIGATSSTAVSPGTLAATLLQELGGIGPLSRRRSLKVLADAMAQHPLAKGIVLVVCTAKGCGALATSDQAYLSHVDECKRLIQKARGETAEPVTFRAQSQEPEHLEGALLAETLGGQSITLLAPPDKTPGVGLLLVEANPDMLGDLKALADLATVFLRIKRPTDQDIRNHQITKALGAAALAALALFLLWPSTLHVTAPALTKPQEARILNLPFDSFLESVDTVVGSKVQEGDVIARMSAPDLESKRSQLEFQMSVQDISAKAALAQNDYGTYQLSMQKTETLRGQLEQITEKLDQLEVHAPVSGTVIHSIGRDALGRFVPTGQEISTIQPDERYSATLTFSRVDAPLIQPGQTGKIYFRGLSDRVYDFTVLTPVFVKTDPDQGSERLVAWARIEESNDHHLISGLSGFAQVEAGRSLRIVNYTRYIREYLKVKAWTYLGLHF